LRPGDFLGFFTKRNPEKPCYQSLLCIIIKSFRFRFRTFFDNRNLVVWIKSYEVSSTSQDPSQHLPKSVIPTQRRVTEQLTKNWAPFKVLRQRYAGTRFEERRQLHLPHKKHKATVADSTLRVEMDGLEEQADNAKARELFWKPLSWLGTIRPTSANDAFDPALWETFISTTLGLEVPTLAALPCLHSSPLAKCGCKKFCMDFHGDHTSTCKSHSGATKAHDWMVSVLGPLFRTAGHLTMWR
jgi:hypothetical protein